MKQLNIHFWLFLVTGINHVMAQNSSGDARFGASCGYLAKKIFCFGGSDSISTSVPSDAMHMLDLSNFSADKPEEFESIWVKVDTDTKTQNILPRRYPQSTQLPDGKTLLVVGGEIYGNSSGVPQTLSFNAETLSWTTYQNFEDPPAKSRQIFDAASVYIPKYGFVLYGGLGIDNLTPYNETAENYINGYTEIEVLDIGNTENPWRPNISASEDVDRVDYRQAAIFDDKMNIIFFFGGRRPGFTDPYDDLPGFKTIDLYNFTSQSWGRKTMWGQGPAPRYGHSATLVGPNQRHVLIYGGQNDDSDRPLADYCYILDLDSYQWTPQVIPVDAGVNLARSRHSAIAITNSTLFIVYGTETETKLAENILILDVTEPLMITLLNKLNSSAASPTDTVPGSSDTDADNPRKGLTSAATIGIGVGVSVAVNTTLHRC
ncbi:uncharacterized protein EV154DRAFT_501085 [Mucor mucedo]|uniref:uncharacterized protein n=1 Tax=Mucor mucedo TaxID=29922 RepID=UPI00222044EC|nr:uncharacterized protein EV154DRAFT_501085 [Mucor mucedo]KAI7893658.1 hypothetical protein EV154DRAFT_501085 [Mucor mucedo]